VTLRDSNIKPSRYEGHRNISKGIAQHFVNRQQTLLKKNKELSQSDPGMHQSFRPVQYLAQVPGKS